MTYKTIKNPDTEFVKRFKKKLKDNNGYCPCRVDKTPDTKCPCLEYRTTGECICGLYIKVPDYSDEEEA